MAQPKFTLYKYIKLADGSWRYCKAAFYSNGKIKPNRCIIDDKEEEHPEGAYYLPHDLRGRTFALPLANDRNALLRSLSVTGRSLSKNSRSESISFS